MSVRSSSIYARIFASTLEAPSDLPSPTAERFADCVCAGAEAPHSVRTTVSASVFMEVSFDRVRRLGRELSLRGCFYARPGCKTSPRRNSVSRILVLINSIQQGNRRAIQGQL